MGQWHKAMCIISYIEMSFRETQKHARLCRIGYHDAQRPSAAYMRQWIMPSLVQTTASFLFVAKPLSELMLDACGLNHWEKIVKFESKYIHFNTKKIKIVFYEAPAIESWDQYFECYKHGLSSRYHVKVAHVVLET